MIEYRNDESPGDRVEPEVEPGHGGGDVGVDPELVGVEGVDREDVPVRRGMSITSQCQKPEPVGASGSKQVTANPLVSSGNPCQLSCGEMFWPVIPNEL